MRPTNILAPKIVNDFLGFQYGDYHSSQFKLYRVSNGNRYGEYLFPTIKNQTIDTVGNEGTLFFGANITTRSFSIDLAFDKLNEEDLRDVREWLQGGLGKVQPLIFDERPYVEYYCALTSTPQFKYLTFTENNDRIYKGEVNIGFTSYYPYGYSLPGMKWLRPSNDGNNDNNKEWTAASRLVPQKYGDNENDLYDFVTWTGAQGQTRVYNSGDVPTDLVVHYNFTISATIPSLTTIESWTCVDGSLGTKLNELTFSMPNLTTGDIISCDINMKTRIIKITKNGVESLGNNLITSGDFFAIPVGASIIKLNCGVQLANGVRSAEGEPNYIQYRHKFL